jgi:hypothetical protein
MLPEYLGNMVPLMQRSEAPLTRAYRFDLPEYELLWIVRPVIWPKLFESWEELPVCRVIPVGEQRALADRFDRVDRYERKIHSSLPPPRG